MVSSTFDTDSWCFIDLLYAGIAIQAKTKQQNALHDTLSTFHVADSLVSHEDDILTMVS